MATDFGGLPITNLSETFDYFLSGGGSKKLAAGGPAAEAVVNGETVQMGRMVTNPNTGLAEPVYNEAPGGDYGAWGFTGTQPQQPDFANMDPVGVAQWQDQQELQQLSIFDTQIAQVQEPLQQQLATLDKQMQVDINSVYNMNLNEESRTNRINQIKANYQKRAIQAQDKIAPQITRLEQAKAAATAQMRMRHILRMNELQTYAAMAERGEVDPGRARAMQLRSLGYDVPLTFFDRSSTTQTPYQQLAEADRIIGAARETLGQYQIEPLRGAGWVRDAKPARFKKLKPITEWKNPQSDNRDPSDYEAVQPGSAEEEAARQAIFNLREAQKRRHEIATQLVGKRVQNLGAGVSEFADGVRRSKPSQRAMASPSPAENLSRLSDAELQRIVNGDR